VTEAGNQSRKQPVQISSLPCSNGEKSEDEGNFSSTIMALIPDQVLRFTHTAT